MKSIETSEHPLLYKVSDSCIFPALPAISDLQVSTRVYARALEGMQKEACVQYGSNGPVWHMVCDEGPYLNGTDLAPFPLAFFTAGLAASYMSELLYAASNQNIQLNAVELVQDNYYGMEGSALRGNMKASALPVNVSCTAESELSAQELAELLKLAVASSPADTILKGSHPGTFSLSKNGKALDVEGVNPSVSRVPADPNCLFDPALPAEDATFAPDGIEKLQAAESVFGVEGGAGSSLHASQKRLLHIRAICTLREDGIKSIKVQLFKPIGGVFHFLSDNSKLAGGQERAPSGLAYMASGIAFCYLTQLGRYAHIVKQQLDAYRVVQDLVFDNSGAGKPHAPDTHTYVDSDEPDELIQKLVQMGEQTCFLHAALQTDNQTQVNRSDITS